MTNHANRRILPPGGQGDARPTARESAAVANAKIISIIDHEVAAALRLTAKDLTSLEAELRQASLDARDQAANDLAFVADNLRHDIKTKTQNFGRDAHALAVVQDKLRQDINTLAAAVNQLCQDVDQLKQGGVTPELSG